MKLNLRERIHFGGAAYYAVGILLLVLLLIPTGVMIFVDPYTGRNDIGEVVTGFVLIVLLPVLLVATIGYYIYLNIALKRRDKKLAMSAYSKHMQAAKFTLSNSMYMIAEGKRDLLSKNSYIGDDWGFCDFQFSLYRKTKHGHYRAETNYYAVAAFTLPRKLPNVFFDSKNTGGREFKKLFRQSQKHSLEGDFDTHHTTYFHEEYTIDNLSFITPEVMLAIKEAKDYDVELYKDTLYLYNELEDMPYQLEDMELKGKNIRTKLLDNIDTYRDERINFSSGRKTVSLLGAQLRRSVLPRYINAALAAAGVIGGIIFMVWENAKYGSSSIFGLYAIFLSAGFFVSNILVIKSIRREDAYYKRMSNIGV